MAQQQRSDERFERIQKQSDKRFERLQLETRQQSTQILEMVHTLAAELRTDTSRQIASLRQEFQLASQYPQLPQVQ